MQQITPIEIRQKSFEKSFRGYKTDEVNAFLQALAYAWEKLIAQLNEVEAALEESKKEVKRLQGVENALLKTIKDSEVTAYNIIEQAKKEADLKTRETELEIGRLLREAQEKAKAIEEDHAREYQRTKERMARALEVTKKRVQEAETYRDTLLQKLQHLAEDILTRGQIIESNFQPHLDIDEELKEKLPKEEPDKAPAASAPSKDTATVSPPSKDTKEVPAG